MTAPGSYCITFVCDKCAETKPVLYKLHWRKREDGYLECKIDLMLSPISWRMTEEKLLCPKCHSKNV